MDKKVMTKFLPTSIFRLAEVFLQIYFEFLSNSSVGCGANFAYVFFFTKFCFFAVLWTNNNQFSEQITLKFLITDFSAFLTNNWCPWSDDLIGLIKIDFWNDSAQISERHL